MQFIILFISTLVFCLCLDLAWLTLIAKSLYLNTISSLMQKAPDGTFSPNYSAGLVVYILMVIGILFFVLPKANGNYLQALFYGALLGLIIYGVYDFTNLAIISNWPLSISLIDMAWGTCLCAITSLFATWVMNAMK